MERLVRIAEALGRFSARYVPSAFSIAILLTVFTFVLAVSWGGASVSGALKGWGDGFWELLTFSMQMALVMFTGYLLALSRPVKRLLEWVASLAKTPRFAVLLMAFASMALAYLNWGLSIVASAMLVRYVARRQPEVDYRLLVACAYFGLGATWHSGLSASAPLLVATPKHFLEAKMGVVPIDQTLFSAFNLVLVAVVVVALTALAWAMHPPKERSVRIDPSLLAKLESAEAPEPPKVRTVAGWLDNAWLLNALFGLGALSWLLRHLTVSAMAPEQAAELSAAWDASRLSDYFRLLAFEGVPSLLQGGWRHININTVNFLFLAAAVVLHRTPSALIKASEEAASVLSGIVLQFPLYAGIYGIFKSTGLTEKIGQLFVSLCTAKSFPAVVYWYSGVVNYFVPSGGSKWAIEAPYLLEAAKGLGVPPQKVVLAYAWGDMATDLIQPFWALPLLSVAKLEFKDILGFLLLTFLVYVPLVSLAFLLFG
ncbi:MAG: short-chain fatty acid transporter [Myxococcales bacterium]|nr:short-chain fatty acid transporter [Myxococcales bacterium]